MQSPRCTRALISVSDKTGLTDLALGLVSAGVEIYSTGGTRLHLTESGIDAIEVSEYTGFPEMMDGRLKTLHPKVFGGILCRRDRSDDMTATAEHEIWPFELVVVNLYPFESTIAKSGTTWDEAIEQIDIGGPSLIRAAAKNHAFVTVVTKPSQYETVLDQVSSQGHTTLELRKELAAAAFARTADYDRAIGSYLRADSRQQSDPNALELPRNIDIRLTRDSVLRYGENPHQKGAIYSVPSTDGPSLVKARQLNGKELSYNNYLDLDSALTIVRSLSAPSTSVIKHNNPCGAASASTLAEATHKALQGDPVSAFGSVLGMNRAVDSDTADVLCEPGLFVEAIIAPDFEPDALQSLTTRPKWKRNVRLMKYGSLAAGHAELTFRQIDGGMLVQNSDLENDPYEQWSVVSNRQPGDEQMDELKFAWSLVRHVKSNAIVLTRNLALCGAGAGQMSRVDSVEIAISKAGDRAKGAVLASDAFFPFDDSIHRAASAGIVAIIQPGGSKGDPDVIAACDEHGIAMIFTGRRHFKH